MVSWCECGNRLSNSQNPEIQYMIYSNDERIDIIENGEKYPNPLMIPYPDRTAWLCPECSRIHVWKHMPFRRVALYELVSTANDK